MERALPRLLEKAHGSGYRIVVTVESQERKALLDTLLWEYDPDSFLPHGTDGDKWPEKQPILLSKDVTPANGATLLCITDGRQIADFSGYERVIDMFDGQDDVATQAARQRWKFYNDND